MEDCDQHARLVADGTLSCLVVDARCRLRTGSPATSPACWTPSGRRLAARLSRFGTAGHGRRGRQYRHNWQGSLRPDQAERHPSGPQPRRSSSISTLSVASSSVMAMLWRAMLISIRAAQVLVRQPRSPDFRGCRYLPRREQPTVMATCGSDGRSGSAQAQRTRRMAHTGGGSQAGCRRRSIARSLELACRGDAT